MTDYLRDLFGLTGNVAVVTGGANGIGLGIATVLAEAEHPSCSPTGTVRALGARLRP